MTTEQKTQCAPRVLIVLGMHRSGTSALTGFLQRLGFHLGDELMEATGDNEKGYFENVGITDLNEALLSRLGSSWQDPAPLPRQWWRQEALQELKAQAARLLDAQFAGQALWAIKDPRICRLLPFWLELLAERGVQVRCVLMLRRPEEVTASLTRRDRLSLNHGLALWLSHVIDAERYSRDLPRTVVTYEGLLDNWRLAAEQIEQLFDGETLLSPASIEDIDAFLSSDLRHHHSGDSGVQSLLLPTLHMLYDRLAAGQSGVEDYVDQLGSERDEFVTLYGRPQPPEALPQAGGHGGGQGVALNRQRVKVAVYSADLLGGPCATLRVTQVAEQQRDAVELRWAVQQDAAGGTYSIDAEALAWADVVIIQRLFPARVTAETLRAIRDSGKLVIYESDDLLVDPDIVPAKVRKLVANSAAYIRDVLGWADLVTVSTEALREEYSAYNPNVVVLPNMVDETLWQAPRSGRDDDVVRLVYAGTASHEEDFQGVIAALEQLLERHPQGLELVFMGYLPERFADHPRVRFIDFNTSYADYLKTLQALQPDIAVAPLLDNRYNLVKSNIKWLEYTMAGAVGVYSNVLPYQHSVQDGVNGFLVGDRADEWLARLELLVSDGALRHAMAQQARRDVLSGYGLGARAASVAAIWHELARLGRSPRAELAASTPARRFSTIDLDHDYLRWRERHAMGEGGAQLAAERMLQQWQVHPGIHLLTCVAEDELALLADTIDSLEQQLYKGWALTVISDAACPDSAFDELPHLEWICTADDPNEVAMTAIDAGNADWVVSFQPGDRFDPTFTFSLADYTNLQPQWRLVYFDEDVIDEAGQHTRPTMKPDFNLDLLRSEPYIGYGYAIRREALLSLGLFNGFSLLGGYQTQLAFLEREPESAMGHIADVLYSRSLRNTEQEDVASYEPLFRDVLQGHLQRLGISAEVGEGLVAGTWRVLYAHEAQPLVSIIIPNKNSIKILTECVDSLLERTDWPNYEVLIVDNGSDVDDVWDYYERLQQEYPQRVRVIEYNQPFNYSAMNNLAAREARGDYLLLLNNDTAIIQDSWLTRMMNHGQRPEVGVVGCRLLYPTSTRIQHAGVVVGMAGVAHHPFIGADMNDHGPLNRLQVDQNYSAVTAACLLIRRSVFEAVGGLDELNLKVLFNDVDLGLKVNQAGYKVVWSPFATVVHHGSKSIDPGRERPEVVARTAAEIEHFFRSWHGVIDNDPAYNRNQSLVRVDCRVESQVVPGWNPDFRDRPRILGYPLDELGCGYYRVYAPLWGLSDAALAHSAFVPSHEKPARPRIPLDSEVMRMGADTLLLQSTLKDNQLLVLDSYRKLDNVFKVFDIDDLKTDVPASNSRAKHLFKDMKHRLRRAIDVCDRLVASTQPLAEAYGDLCDDVIVLPNFLSRERWGGHTSRRGAGRKPRVGWAGAQQHHGDLAIIAPLVKALADEVEWVFFGMCLDELRPYVSEVHEFVSVNDYPAKLASLDLDLALAPLELNRFNEAKTNLRLLEYGINGWPVICSDIYPYQEGPVTRLANDPAVWTEAVREAIRDLDALALQGERMRTWVEQNWMLEDNLGRVLKALTP